MAAAPRMFDGQHGSHALCEIRMGRENFGEHDPEPAFGVDSFFPAASTRRPGTAPAGRKCAPNRSHVYSHAREYADPRNGTIIAG